MSTATPSHFRSHIEEHFEVCEFDVICRKKKTGYNIYWADDELPLARLCPTKRADEVDIFWWDDDHWEPVGEFGLAMPLDEALEFITDDPQGLFFEDDEEDDFEEDYGAEDYEASEADFFSAAVHLREFREALDACGAQLLISTVLGGGLGGLCSGTRWGLALGAATAPVLFAAFNWKTSQLRVWLTGVLILGIPAAMSAAVAGSLGACLTEALGAGAWGRTAGFVVGAICALLVVVSRHLAWWIAFASGLAVGLWLAQALGIIDHTWGYVFAALLAAGLAKLLGVVRSYTWEPLAKLLRRVRAQQTE
jgi:hypothetical protein